MAFQNLTHRSRSTTPGNAVFSPDGKMYRLVSVNGITHVTPSLVGQQAHLQSSGHAAPGQSLTSSTGVSMTTSRHVPHMSPVSNGCYMVPKPQKESPHQGRSMEESMTNRGQVEKLMSLLLYKDGQISDLTSRIETMHASLQNSRMKDKQALQEAKLLRSELESKEREVAKLTDDLAVVKTGKRKIALEKGKLEKHLDSKASEFSEMTQKVQTMAAEMVSLKKTNLEIWDERRGLKQMLEETDAKFRSSSEMLEKISENLNQVKTQKQKVELEKKKLEAEKRKLEKSKEEAFQTVQVLKAVIQQKENRIDQLQGKLKEVTKESSKVKPDIAVCDCPGKDEQLQMIQKLKENEESEARMGDMLAKMKSQIQFLDMEKEKARQQMIQAWDSETNLRTELEKQKSQRTDLEKQLGKFKKNEKVNAKVVHTDVTGHAELNNRLKKYESQNTDLKKKIKELELKLDSVSDPQNELTGEEKEERCKRLYKDLLKYEVSPTDCRDVTRTVLKHLTNRSMKLPGKDFAWSAQQKKPPTPQVSDDEDLGGESDDNDEDYRGSEDGEGSDSLEITPRKKHLKSSTEKRKSEITKKLEEYGGLWCNPEEMEDHLNALDEEERKDAVIVQLRYRSVVLELARESKLLDSSLTGKQKSFRELKASLLKMLKKNKRDSTEHEDCKKEESSSESILEARKRMYSPGPDHPILRPRKKQSSRRTWRKVPFESLHGKVIDRFMCDSEGYKDWQKGVVIEHARNHLTIIYESAKDCPVKLPLKAAKREFDRGDLVACDVTIEDFVGKVIENLWLMENGATEWWKGHVLKSACSRGEDTEFEIAYSESKEEFMYFVPLMKDYWGNEARILSI